MTPNHRANHFHSRCLACLALFSILLSACRPQASHSYFPKNPAVGVLQQTRPERFFGTPSPASTASPTAVSPNPTPTRKRLDYTTYLEDGFGTPAPTRAAPLLGYEPLRYRAQAGDTLFGLANRFGIPADDILALQELPQEALIYPGELLLLPIHGKSAIATLRLFPDSEVVYGPQAQGFDVAAYLEAQGGYLATFREYYESSHWTGAAEIVRRVAVENSVNPKLLLALLEWECGCVLGDQTGLLENGYGLGVEDFHYRWLYGQLSWAARQLTEGYYGWRMGLSGLADWPDDIISFPSPDSNAGSVALLTYFAHMARTRLAQQEKAYLHSEVACRLDRYRETVFNHPTEGFLALYERMFGDPWQVAGEPWGGSPLYSAGTSPQQPEMILPFEPGRLWAFTNGPHEAWRTSASLAALDFAPATRDTGCNPTDAWAVAVADGVVIRSETGLVVQDLDGDGYEGTGWVVLYVHIATQGRIPVGTVLRQGERLGQPSCEGGFSTGTHLHLARKYNGEWIPAAGPLPFVLDGWTAFGGEKQYEGYLKKGDQTVIAHLFASFETNIQRPEEATPTAATDILIVDITENENATATSPSP